MLSAFVTSCCVTCYYSYFKWAIIFQCKRCYRWYNENSYFISHFCNYVMDAPPWTKKSDQYGRQSSTYENIQKTDGIGLYYIRNKSKGKLLIFKTLTHHDLLRTEFNKMPWERIFGRRCTRHAQSFLCVLGMCEQCTAEALYILGVGRDT